MWAMGSTAGLPFTGWTLPLSTGLLSKKSVAVARYHAVADEGIPLREIASMIGHRLILPVVSKTLEEAKDHFDWSTQFVAGGVPASSRWTRERLAWQPRQPGLLADVDQPDYFAAGVAPVV
jgi:hypothetical protein